MCLEEFQELEADPHPLPGGHELTPPVRYPPHQVDTVLLHLLVSQTFLLSITHSPRQPQGFNRHIFNYCGPNSWRAGEKYYLFKKKTIFFLNCRVRNKFPRLLTNLIDLQDLYKFRSEFADVYFTARTKSLNDLVCFITAEWNVNICKYLRTSWP